MSKKCSMQRKIESLQRMRNHSLHGRKDEHFVSHTTVTTSWEFDKEIAADVIEEVGFGTFSRECNLDSAERWEEYFKNKDEKGFAEAVQDHIDAGFWDGYVADTGSLSNLEFARLMIYLYYNRCDQT